MLTNKNLQRYGISGSTLKILACLIMLIDHSAVAILRYGILNGNPFSLSPETVQTLGQFYKILRKVGRPAFPIFCFLLVEGFLHTRNEWDYLKKMVIFSLLSELPFDFALSRNDFLCSFSFSHLGDWIRQIPSSNLFQHQNVYFTLAIGLLVLIAMDRAGDNILLALSCMFIGMRIAWFLHTDYSYKGVGMIAMLYLFRFRRELQLMVGALTSAWEMPAPAAYLFVCLYNGTRGLKLKYFFYFFYPVHLILLGLIRMSLPLFR